MAVMEAGARVIHVDVMDGHFVPPISIGDLIVAALRDQVREAGGLLDVHLMVARPERRIDEFAAASADSIAVHWEATPHVHYALKAVRDAGLHAGLAINPATPPEAVVGLADMYDHLLCMTVNPGWGGQPYIETSTAKVARLRELLPEGMPIQVDGGIDSGTAGPVAEAGATLFVAGSSSASPIPPPPTARLRPPPAPNRRRSCTPSACGGGDRRHEPGRCHDLSR